MKITNVVTWGIVSVSGALAGCVGYDGGSDGASLTARSLELTQAEESRIREALSRKALSADAIARMEADLEERVLPTDWTAQSYQSASARWSGPDWGLCAGDINCASSHCSQAGVCVPEANLKAVADYCVRDDECQSHRCTRTVPGDIKTWKCSAAPSTDKDGVQNNGETDVDCGGTQSPYACPVGGKCSIDNDCVAGGCFALTQTLTLATKSRTLTTTTTTKTCQIQNGSAIDLGRAWTSGSSVAAAPYPKLMNLVAETGDADQKSRVSNASPLYAGKPDGTAVLTEARRTRTYEHDQCMRHLVANGCSSVGVRVRLNRASYDYVICPKANRVAIRITTTNGTKLGERTIPASSTALGATPAYVDYGSPSARGGSFSGGILDDDPYLCNHQYTHGVRVLSKTKATDPAPLNAILPLSTDIAGANSRWDGYAVQESGAVASVSEAALKPNSPSKSADAMTKLVTWYDQLQRSLLMNAACTRGRLALGGTRQLTSPTWAGKTSTDIANLCTKYTPWNVVRSGTALPTDTWSQALTSDEIAFIKENVSWYDSYDVYSIDPEGNPYLPENMNMQYRWDSMYPTFSFGAYALDWGATLTLGTGSYSTVYGQTTNNTWSAFGWSVY